MKTPNTSLILFYTGILITCLLSSCNQQKSTSTGIASPEDTLAQIPDEWIEKLKAVKNYQKESSQLVNEFYFLLYKKKPWTNTLLSINPTFVNLDQSPENELLINLRIDRWESFSIIKKIRQKWCLLYENAFGGPIPNNQVIIHANNPGKKIVELTTYHSQTPGTYGTGIQGCMKKVFFRIENNRVKTVLSTVSDYNSTPTVADLSILNQKVQARVLYVNQQNITLGYTYAFYPGIRIQGPATLSNPPYTFESLDQPIFRGVETVKYQWNQANQRYELKDQNQQKKLTIFNSAWLGKQFHKVFRPTLDSLSTQGDGRPHTKAIVQQVIKKISELPDDGICPPCGKAPLDYYQSRKRK
ncbi:hypothetical protein BKI52_41255 [marine bacterium AO1-C]|nr:hypothetical protein BKI52_41255 [marine bacterium AO1-C]